MERIYGTWKCSLLLMWWYDSLKTLLRFNKNLLQLHRIKSNFHLKSKFTQENAEICC